VTLSTPPVYGDPVEADPLQPEPVDARRRAYGWQDPVATAAGADGRTGLEFLRAIAAGELPPPPIALTLGLSLAEVAEGRAVFTLEPAEFHYNPLGTVHGGVALTLIDSANGCAVQTLLPRGAGYTTLETKANFVRAVTVDSGLLRCTAEAVHVGRSTATAQARVEDEGGRLLAHGTSTMLVLRG
jgi:uncharacterized protein (TIGR00369 family)